MSISHHKHAKSLSIAKLFHMTIRSLTMLSYISIVIDSFFLAAAIYLFNSTFNQPRFYYLLSDRKRLQSCITFTNFCNCPKIFIKLISKLISILTSVDTNQ